MGYFIYFVTIILLLFFGIIRYLKIEELKSYLFKNYLNLLKNIYGNINMSDNNLFNKIHLSYYPKSKSILYNTKIDNLNDKTIINLKLKIKYYSRCLYFSVTIGFILSIAFIILSDVFK